MFNNFGFDCNLQIIIITMKNEKLESIGTWQAHLCGFAAKDCLFHALQHLFLKREVVIKHIEKREK